MFVSFAPKPPPPPRRLTEISHWLHAFAYIQYKLVMVGYLSHRAPDLIWYQLLTLRAHAKFRVVPEIRDALGVREYPMFLGVGEPIDVLIAQTSHTVHQFGRSTPPRPPWGRFSGLQPPGLAVADILHPMCFWLTTYIRFCGACLVSCSVC